MQLRALFLITALSLAASNAADKPTLRAGAAVVDITPKVFPLNMPGGHSANMADGAHDPLNSRALVLDDGKTKLVMVVVDNLGAGPEVLDEVKAIASDIEGLNDPRYGRLRARTLIGTDATETAVFAAAPKARILHFATHYLAEETDHGSFSALALAMPALPGADDDGFLTVHDIFEHWRDRLSATELVVLSACESQGGPQTLDEGVFAMPLALLFAGVPSVVGSLWRVEDQSTADLMSDFYRRLFEPVANAASSQPSSVPSATPCRTAPPLRSRVCRTEARAAAGIDPCPISSILNECWNEQVVQRCAEPGHKVIGDRAIETAVIPTHAVVIKEILVFNGRIVNSLVLAGEGRGPDRVGNGEYGRDLRRACARSADRGPAWGIAAAALVHRDACARIRVVAHIRDASLC